MSCIYSIRSEQLLGLHNVVRSTTRVLDRPGNELRTRRPIPKDIKLAGEYERRHFEWGASFTSTASEDRSRVAEGNDNEIVAALYHTTLHRLRGHFLTQAVERLDPAFARNRRSPRDSKSISRCICFRGISHK